jgi:lysophospholipase L1-like esterase
MRRTAAFILCGGIALAATCLRAADGFTFSEKQEASKYIGTFRKWLETDAAQVKQKDAVLCIGSSSMRGWRDIKTDLAPLTIIHRGFGGSTIGQVLLFKDFFLRYQARTILIYEGDNDLNSSRYTPESFAAQCREFCDAVWALRPDTTFYFISVKPSPSRASKWEKMQQGNTLLQAYAAENERINYVDVATPMLGEDGKPKPEIFVKDNLHMNRKGYEIWRDVVREALLGED